MQTSHAKSGRGTESVSFFGSTRTMSYLASLAVPSLLCLIAILLFFSDFFTENDLFSEFTRGCADGLRTTVSILPTLLLLSVAVRAFTASGGMRALCSLFLPFCRAIRFPEELLPTILMRSISGSGTTALLIDLFERYSPDSFAGRCASILLGSSDTIFYTVSVYFSSIQEKSTGYTLPVAFIVMVFCVTVSYSITRLYFGA